MGGLEVRGKENVPSTGPLIVASIHLSHLDPPLIGSVCPRQVRFMAKEELFKNPVFAWLIRSLGAFPIKRGTSDMNAIKLTLKWLEGGNTVLIFPEGQRGDGETMRAFQPGAAMLAKRSGAQVVPLGISGTETIMPKGGKGLKRARVTVVFGQPLLYSQFETTDDDKLNRQAFLDELAYRIQSACGDGGLQLKTGGEETPQTTSHQPQTQTSAPSQEQA